MKAGLIKLAVFLLVIFAAAGVGINAVSAATPAISAKNIHMKVGQTYRLKLKNAKKVVWKTSDKKVVTVTGKGKLTAKGEGTATITARSKGKSYTSTVTVSAGVSTSIVIYFSATGNTEAAALKVREAAAADIVSLLPKKAYIADDLNYHEASCRANKEQNKKSYVAYSTVIKNLDQYDTIYLGYPIWHGKEPGVIRKFLKSSDLKGKTIIPFCTSGGSGISGSMANIRSLASDAEVMDGKDLTYASDDEIKAWTGSFAKNKAPAGTAENEADTMIMKIGNTEVDVVWEDNASVSALKELASSGLTIQMSMYGGFEQVGSIGQSIVRDDRQTTTSAGDIVLYSGDRLVVFYGSNSWAYTSLGKIDLPKDKLTELLGSGDVTITLTTDRGRAK